MRKTIYFILLCAVSTFAVSCLSSEEDTLYEDYTSVYGGIELYSQASVTNNYALDGISVAMRLGVLLDEMSDSGLEFGEDSSTSSFWSGLGTISYVIAGREYNKKEFLFGGDYDSTIEKVSETEYTVTFGKSQYSTYGGGYYDNYQRLGGYRITTNGESLSTTGAEWSVELLEEDGLTFEVTGATLLSSVSVLDYSATITNSGSGKFTYTASIEMCSDAEDATISEWSIEESTLTITTYKSLLMEDTLDATFSHDVSSASGTTISGESMQYYTSVALSYTPNKYYLKQLTGNEVVTIFDYDSVVYPADTVLVKSTTVGGTWYYYNGASYYHSSN